MNVATILKDFRKAGAYNALNIGVKIATALVWGAIDNAKLLGFFTMASVPSSIMQRGMTAGLVAQTFLPAVHSPEEESAYARTAVLMDVSFMAAIGLVLTAVFFATRAEILANLTVPIYAAALIFSLAEAFPSTAISTAIARKRFLWTFLLNASRNVAIIAAALAAYRFRPGSGRIGIGVWAASLAAVCAVAAAYFKSQKIGIFAGGPERNFMRQIMSKLHDLGFYRISALLFGSLPALLISYAGDPVKVGLFSFAFMLSNFIIMSVSPAMEQIFTPEIGRNIFIDGDLAKMRKTALTMCAVSFGAAAILGASLAVFGKLILNIAGKTGMSGSFVYLYPLLVNQALMAGAGGLTYSLFCVKKYRSLALTYLIPFAAYAVGAFFVEDFVGKVWLLAFAPAACCAAAFFFFNALSDGDVIYARESNHAIAAGRADAGQTPV